MSGEAPTRLWEVEHPYYCSESNYYSNDTGEQFESWAEFASAWDSYDLDLNLLFRWDWKIEEYEGEDRPKGSHRLQLFYVLQRKGIFMCIEVDVTPQDEPQVREWLQVRWDKMLELWRPLT